MPCSWGICEQVGYKAGKSSGAFLSRNVFVGGDTEILLGRNVHLPKSFWLTLSLNQIRS